MILKCVSVFLVVTYTVKVYTGKEKGSSTDADAYIHLFGSRGDAGSRSLVRSDQQGMFRDGQIDTFEIEAVSLQTIEKVILGHNGKNKGMHLIK